MTHEEFRSWYDTLSQDDQIKVIQIIADEKFDLGAPEEVTEKVRDTIRDKFYGKSEHRMSREDFNKWRRLQELAQQYHRSGSTTVGGHLPR